MAVNIIKRLERYLITVIDSPEATKKEKAAAARQLTQLKLLRAQPKQARADQTASNTVLGSKG